MGAAYLTNFRLVFETVRSRGVLRAPQEIVIVNCPLDYIVNASVGKALMGRPVLYVQARTGQGEFEFSDPARWQGEIAAVRAAPRGGVPPVVERTIERQVVKVRCRNCGSLNPETDRVCEACKAPL